MPFWEFCLVMLVVVPLAIVWFGCVIDVIARSDVFWLQKIAWTLGMLIFPIFGCAVYLITRPREVDNMAQPGMTVYAGANRDLSPASAEATRRVSDELTRGI
jgi:hypothetical protein